MLKPSFLHRAFGWQPGFVPSWFASRDSCIGADVLVISEAALVFAALRLRQVAILPAIGLVALAFLFGLFVHMPFDSAERFAWARRRRNECVICGKKLQSKAEANCDDCGRI